VAPIWAELAPLTPPVVEPPTYPIGCPVEAAPKVVDGCAFALVPAALAIEREQRLTLGDWYADRARICHEYRTIDRAYAADLFADQRHELTTARRQNTGLRWTVAGAAVGGVFVGVASSALAVWLLSEAAPAE
jgi:hypothetical protein